MIRFAVKSALALGLGTAVFAGGGEMGAGEGEGLDLSRQIAGAQSAIADVGGFCGRAPEACAAGAELSAFLGRMVVEGVALAYRSARQNVEPDAPSGLEAAAGHTPPPVSVASRTEPRRSSPMSLPTRVEAAPSHEAPARTAALPGRMSAEAAKGPRVSSAPPRPSFAIPVPRPRPAR